MLVGGKESLTSILARRTYPCDGVVRNLPAGGADAALHPTGLARAELLSRPDAPH